MVNPEALEIAWDRNMVVVETYEHIIEWGPDVTQIYIDGGGSKKPLLNGRIFSDCSSGIRLCRDYIGPIFVAVVKKKNYQPPAPLVIEE